MKKIICSFLLLSSLALASTSVNKREKDALEDRLRLYKVGYEKKAFTLKNHLGKREIVIDNRLRDLPQTSRVSFGDRQYNRASDWEVTREKRGIQYFAVPGTTRRKAVQKIDGRYVVFFYNAIGKNDDMVESTFKDVRKALERN
ncbi:hypothetical protein [uncultured Cetobacterium sp.]|uniref:hypothetical protein n=1 Tax=uncultured Cetobacterium sp. TaxID=527638 RepID=UPI002637B2BC|nr:hypothetical protein [uncultured Cetobacterium sp.]